MWSLCLKECAKWLFEAGDGRVMNLKYWPLDLKWWFNWFTIITLLGGYCPRLTQVVTAKRFSQIAFSSHYNLDFDFFDLLPTYTWNDRSQSNINTRSSQELQGYAEICSVMLAMNVRIEVESLDDLIWFGFLHPLTCWTPRPEGIDVVFSPFILRMEIVF